MSSARSSGDFAASNKYFRWFSSVKTSGSSLYRAVAAAGSVWWWGVFMYKSVFEFNVTAKTDEFYRQIRFLTIHYASF